MAGLALAAVIAGLREQLTEAIDEGAGKGMRFQLEPIELTLQTVVTDEGHGKVGWKVLEAGASRASESTQSLTLRLTPVWQAHDGSLIRDFTIAAVGRSGSTFGPQP